MAKPKELVNIWSPTTKEAWDNLNPKQQAFITEWVNNGLNATNAYTATYNDKATNGVARASGSRILADLNIQKIIGALAETNKTDLYKIKNVYANAMDSDNEAIQLKGADSLAKLNGELIDRTKIEHSGKIDTEMDISKLSDKELLQLKALREKME